MHRFSEEALNRPQRTIQAAKILREKAEAIVHVTGNATEDEVVIAIISSDLTFGGLWTLSRDGMSSQIAIIEEKGGWSFTFSPHTTREQVDERCDELIGLASRRWDAMQRWLKRHNS